MKRLGLSRKLRKRPLIEINGCLFIEGTEHRSSEYISFHSKGKPIRAHRYYYIKAKGEIPEGLVLDHLCKRKNCVNPEHLEPVLQIENTRRGSLTKLTPEKVREIRRLLETEVPTKEIAYKFRVSDSCIRYVANKIRWQDI